MSGIWSDLFDELRYLTTIGIADIFDILIIAFLIYKVLGLIIRTKTYLVARGVIVLLAALWLSGILGLHVINFLMRKAVEIGLIALVVLFQPELRRVLEKVGSSSVRSLFGTDISNLHTENVITQTVLACTEMSASRTGALIIFERVNQLTEQIDTGTVLDAEVSAELLKNIFFVKAPMHDGAVIVRSGRIAAAGCMLPMSGNLNLSKDLGMRHRAGIGMSERSDAVVVIVSEETGAISIAVEGMLRRHLSPNTVETLLRRELLPDTEKSGAKQIPGFALLKKVRSNDNNK